MINRTIAWTSFHIKYHPYLKKNLHENKRNSEWGSVYSKVVYLFKLLYHNQIIHLLFCYSASHFYCSYTPLSSISFSSAPHRIFSSPLLDASSSMPLLPSFGQLPPPLSAALFTLSFSSSIHPPFSFFLHLTFLSFFSLYLIFFVFINLPVSYSDTLPPFSLIFPLPLVFFFLFPPPFFSIIFFSPSLNLLSLAEPIYVSPKHFLFALSFLTIFFSIPLVFFGGFQITFSWILNKYFHASFLFDHGLIKLHPLFIIELMHIALLFLDPWLEFSKPTFS